MPGREASHWSHFSHQADIGVRGEGASLVEAFSGAAEAMTAVITDPKAVAQSEAVQISCQAPDPEILLVDWLNALIYEMATRRMLFSRFDLRIEGEQLTATAWGEAVDVSRHQPTVEVKGATYTALEVRQLANGRWVAQCVVDV
jgi:SHS2 domain-containing protein